MSISIKPKKCKVCGDKFIPKFSTLEPVCDKFDCRTQFALRHVEKQRQKKILVEKSLRIKEKKQLKEQVKTLSDWKKELQKEINIIVRLIDKGHLCISSRKPLKDKADAGHFMSVGSNPSIRFNLFNIYAQSVHSNQYKSGDILNYIDGLKQEFGQEHLDYVLDLKNKYPVLKLTEFEIKEKIPIARGIIKWLKLQDRKFTNQERLTLRKEFNLKLQIYNE